MKHVYEVCLVGYTPEDWYVDETVGMFADRAQAQRLVDELLGLWPEEREGLVPTLVEHELGRISDTNLAIALAERQMDALLSCAESGDPVDGGVMDAVLGGHTIDGPVADELRSAYAAFVAGDD